MAWKFTNVSYHIVENCHLLQWRVVAPTKDIYCPLQMMNFGGGKFHRRDKLQKNGNLLATQNQCKQRQHFHWPWKWLMIYERILKCKHSYGDTCMPERRKCASIFFRNRQILSNSCRVILTRSYCWLVIHPKDIQSGIIRFKLHHLCVEDICIDGAKSMFQRFPFFCYAWHLMNKFFQWWSMESECS